MDWSTDSHAAVSERASDPREGKKTKMGKTEEGDALIPHFRHQERSSLQHHADLTLELHADVADWNPNTGFQRLLAVGTYELDEATRLRHGRLYTY